MARPERNTVDYFPHYISDGKKMFFIEHKYGNDGYSTWFKILESLAITEHHYLDLKNESDIMFLSAKCRISENILIDILNDLAKLGEIDLELWNEKIVFSDKFIESIQDAYTRRNNKCMQKVDLCKHLISLCRIKSTFLSKKIDNNTQSKVKKSKVNETIDDKPIVSDVVLHPMQEYISKNYPIVSKMKSQLTFDEATKLHNEYDPKAIKEILDAMENYKDIHKKNSVYLTIKNWIRRNQQTNPNFGKREQIVTNSNVVHKYNPMAHF